LKAIIPKFKTLWVYYRSQQKEGETMTTKKRVFSPMFRLESAQLVANQNCSLKDAAKAIGMGKPTF